MFLYLKMFKSQNVQFIFWLKIGRLFDQYCMLLDTVDIFFHEEPFLFASMNFSKGAAMCPVRLSICAAMFIQVCVCLCMRSQEVMMCDVTLILRSGDPTEIGEGKNPRLHAVSQSPRPTSGLLRRPFYRQAGL